MIMLIKGRKIERKCWTGILGKGSRELAGLLLFSAVFFISSGACAQDTPGGSSLGLQEVGFFSGYGKGDLESQKTLEFMPAGVRFGFNLRPLGKKLGWEPKGLLELVCEPYFGYNFQPKDTLEFGLAFFLKYGFPFTEKLYTFIELGTGPYYMTWSTDNQSTQFNFNSQGGLGLLYFLDSHWGVNTAFRYRHVSNADIKKPNGGIQSLVYLIGFSYYY
jgi:lipid A 3-O-deacylase